MGWRVRLWVVAGSKEIDRWQRGALWKQVQSWVVAGSIVGGSKIGELPPFCILYNS